MIDEREKLIGASLRAFRETLQISRSKFAVRIGFGSERIASYESGRAPLPYDVFRAVAKCYHINPRWLATGIGSPRLPFPFDDASILGLVKPRDLFSAVYDSHLKRQLQTEAAESSQHVDALEKKLHGLMGFFDDCSISMSLREKWAKRLVNTLEKVRREAGRELKKRKSIREQIVKYSNLTDVSESVNIMSVKRQMPFFRDRLKKATAQRGNKTVLAKFLGVPLASVSQWLSGKREPGGEITLKMLRWVEQQERKK